MTGLPPEAITGAGEARNARVIALMEEAENYCWASPAGWDDDTPGKPHCNRLRGHDGNHVMHVVWAPDTDLSTSELAFAGEAWVSAAVPATRGYTDAEGP